MKANYYIFLGLFIFILMIPNANAANRLLYENFNDQVIDVLCPRIYGAWGDRDGVNEGDEYDLDKTGYGGSGYCFTSTTSTTNNKNECYLTWESVPGYYTGPPGPWPTSEWYVSFRVRFPTFTSTVSHENIKMFYPKWDGGTSHVAYDATGGNSCYHSEKSNGNYLVNGTYASTPNLLDGNWHRMEFYTNTSTGVHRMWFDRPDSASFTDTAYLKKDYNWGSSAWGNTFTMNYFTVGSIDASGDSIFNRQFDEVEIWDGMPDGSGGSASTIEPPPSVGIDSVQ